MRVIRIEESKLDKMSDHVEKALKSMGKIMQCLEELSDGEMGERDDDEEEDFGMRGGSMGSRGGRMGERRRGRSGRYM